MGLCYSSATKQDPGTGKQAELTAVAGTAGTESSSEQFVLPTRQADTEGTQKKKPSSEPNGAPSLPPSSEEPGLGG